MKSARSRTWCSIIFLSGFLFAVHGCAGIEIRSLLKPHVNMADYRTFTIINQVKSDDKNYLRDEVLLDHASHILSLTGYQRTSADKAKAHVTLVFTEGYEKVFVPPSTQPIISYTQGEFTTVTGTLNGQTVNFFGYIPPQRIEHYVEVPAHNIDVYRLALRIDIYDAKNLNQIWSGTAYMESSPANAVPYAKKMIDKLLRQGLPGI
ncbi:MAG: DUF4136 domain-containing protein [Nitrospirae bacterium]|nr:DUF4136 domain-containing protein [Nitrospirota bacterium]